MARALIVEDSPIYRGLLKEQFQEHFPSLAVDEAGSAEEGLQKINEPSPPDFMFIDIRLPGLNGLQLTQKVKTEFPGIRIAILTGYDLPEYERAARQYGADRFFVKDLFRWDQAEEFVNAGRS